MGEYFDKEIYSLYDVAKELRKNKENLARTPTNEMGKALKEAKTEVDKCVLAIECFADNGNFSFILCDILSITAIISLIVHIEDITCMSFLYRDDIFDTKSEPIPI